MTMLPPWKNFLQSSLKDNIAKVGTSATYASLATVTSENKPAVRTVVMRGFAGEHHTEQTSFKSDLLVIITDGTSHKIKEIKQNPNTEINWYMNGTMEQFRISGTIDIVDKKYDQDSLNHLNSSMTFQELDDNHQKSLALESFLIQQQPDAAFNWQAERLRQFIQVPASLRARMVHSTKQEKLDIKTIDANTGWFLNDEAQELLEEAFENFVLLIIRVTSVRHWSPTTGTKSML